jgi:hypothetical protein
MNSLENMTFFRYYGRTIRKHTDIHDKIKSRLDSENAATIYFRMSYLLESYVKIYRLKYTEL